VSYIYSFGELKVVVSQILLDGAQQRDAGTSWLSSPGCLQLLEISWNLKTLLEILEISWNLNGPPGNFCVMIEN